MSALGVATPGIAMKGSYDYDLLVTSVLDHSDTEEVPVWITLRKSVTLKNAKK